MNYFTLRRGDRREKQMNYFRQRRRERRENENNCFTQRRRERRERIYMIVVMIRALATLPPRLRVIVSY